MPMFVYTEEEVSEKCKAAEADGARRCAEDRDKAYDECKRLRIALRGGNATKDNAELLEWLADRLVSVHGENPNTDYILATRERAKMIRAALKTETVQ